MFKNSLPIVKCSHCKIILSRENFESHTCNLPLVGVKRIPVVYFQDDSVNGEKIMTGRGVNGILYSFVVVSRTQIPYMKGLSDVSYHDDESNDKLPEPALGFCFTVGSRLSLLHGGSCVKDNNAEFYRSLLREENIDHGNQGASFFDSPS
jgi:hypothetical protein